jgi:tRNA(Ile)-lysidine synthase
VPKERERGGSRWFFMRTPIENKLKSAIKASGLLAVGDRVLVATSGGSDSTALLYLLHSLREELALQIEVAHLQHGMRGDEADRDARFVAQTARELSLRFHLKAVNVVRLKAVAGEGNIEAIGRKERYDFFSTTAIARRLNKVATGHTRDDQVETLLMRLLRGSGKTGLAGMPTSRLLPSAGASVSLIRPLMGIWRHDLIAYLRERGVAYQVDATNQDLRMLRNWVRLRALPFLRSRLGRRLDERLAEMAAILGDEDRFLESLSVERLTSIREGDSLRREELLMEPMPMQRRLVRSWLKQSAGHLRGITAFHVAAAIRFIESGPPQGRLSLPGSQDLVKSYGRIRLEPKKSLTRTTAAANYSYSLPEEGEIAIPEAKMRMRCSRLPWTPELWPRNHHEAVFDSGALPLDRVVRNVRAGDRFRPLGLNGRKKLKDLLIDNKVPLAARRILPVVIAGGEIVWVPGLARSAVAAVGDGTKEVFRIQLIGDDPR